MAYQVLTRVRTPRAPLGRRLRRRGVYPYLDKGRELGAQEGEGLTATEKQGCRHHWVIDTPEGPVSRGTCKLCGAEKEFKNILDVGLPLWEKDPQLQEVGISLGQEDDDSFD